MRTVATLPTDPAAPEPAYRAVTGSLQTVGRTPGAALDALIPQLDRTVSGTLVVIQELRPDHFFTAAQQQRLADLMTRWRAARDQGTALPPQEQSELDALVEAELRAATDRAAAMVRGLAP